MPQLDKEALRRQTEKNCQLLRSDEFLEQLNAVLEAREGERVDEAAKRLTPEALRRAGVKLPEGLRVSSRYFEPSLKKPLEFGDTSDRKNILATLSEISPGILGKIKKVNPDLLEDINIAQELPGDIGPLAACGGVGAASVCACFGT